MAEDAIQTTEIFGRGFAFPFAFDPLTGGVAGQRGQELVIDDFVYLMGTRIQERIMNATLGSKIDTLLFDLDTSALHNLLKTYIQEVVAQEPRIETVTKIAVAEDNSDSHAVNVTISLRLLHQNDDRNIVIPLLRG